MLPQIAVQQQRIIQQSQSPHHAFFPTQNKMEGAQPLPYRRPQCQQSSTEHVTSQRTYSVHHNHLEPPKFRKRATQAVQTHAYDVSEHMLRRKTPNGTLAAGYDGTPVQWSTKPPAFKHMILPASGTSLAENTYVETGLDEILPPIPDLHNMHGYRSLPSDSAYGSSRTSINTITDRTRLPPPIAGPNTIFDHIHMHQAPTYFLYNTNAMQVPTVLQPPCQPCSGPTASNDEGFYGPYWPNGKFVPYRPAAIRHANPHRFSSNDLTMGDIPLLSHGNSEIHPRNGIKLRNASFTRCQQITGSNCVVGEEFIFESNEPGLSMQPHPLTPVEDGFQKFRDQDALQRSTPMSGAGQTNAQFKEKALIWAHSVYIDLLTHLQHLKKGAHHSRRSQGQNRPHSQASSYPKPPWQYFNSTAHLSAERYKLIDAKLAAIHSGVSMTGRRASHPLNAHSEPKRNSIGSTSIESAKRALDMLTNLCQESGWLWIDGMLLGGCLAYALEDYNKALDWYNKILSTEPSHVEAISNLAATLLSLNRREEAEQYWLQSIRLRPSHFEAVEHLIGLLCAEHRGHEAVNIIDFVERSLRISDTGMKQDRVPISENGIDTQVPQFEQRRSPRSCHVSYDASSSCSDPMSDSTDRAFFDFKRGIQNLSFGDDDSVNQSGFGSSGYAILGSENGRMLSLVHAKGNMLYALGDVSGAEHAFENAVLLAVGRRVRGIRGLIQNILQVLSANGDATTAERKGSATLPLLLPPDKALQTAKLLFASEGELPGLQYIPEGIARRAAISTTSNSLLSLAKIFQDGMSNTQSVRYPQRPSGVGDILALYYLSLSLQPSPSTANNVGILLASVQHTVAVSSKATNSLRTIPGVIPGSGIALALAYYNYGLHLDSRHAHLYTNLGSLLKDIGQLAAAIKMYEQAVTCDTNFDIALANLANAVKDQGRISDAIEYYKRAVVANPDFAEAVCGLANALNSVCDWTGRGGVLLEGGRLDRWHVDDNGMLCDAEAQGTSAGWMKRVVEIVSKQLEDGANWGRGILQGQVLHSVLRQLEIADCGDKWSLEKSSAMQAKLSSWVGNAWEGARIVRIIERAIKRAMHRWYQDLFVNQTTLPRSSYARPQLPNGLSIPGAPTVLPFHTFTCPLAAKDIRMISQRNALRISCSTLRAPWLPMSVYAPPPPPNPTLNIGYVSSDFNNHPLAHLMQSVFGFHDPSRAKAFCYATTPSDHSVHREQIEREAPVFHDASRWSSEILIQQILHDGIHILVNLNGYTRGARNEVFAARPTPVQMSFMGFAGTLGAEWCDYLLADKIAVPPETLRPWRRNIELDDQLQDDEDTMEENWVYSENVIFCRDTFFCCDHRQSSHDPQIPWEEERKRRWRMRKELFPNLSDDAVILGNFNQLYKIEPTTFRTWLRILSRVPKAILWLLRFPDLGENNLKRTARLWAGEEVASRIWFTDVAPKHQHISRARVCDLFLDTPECNAHTTAADVLWSSTPLLTLPRYKYKMCSRMAASILIGALPKTPEGEAAASELIAKNENQYEHYAVNLATGLIYGQGGAASGRLFELRKLLYESRMTCTLFDTKRWVADLELAYQEAWRRWVGGISGDIYL